MGLALPEYTWFIVVGSFAAFAFGFATGSNDVANAFATSVGSRTLTMRQAVLIAAVFEFAGALLLSRVSTSVIAKGVADVKAFQNNPPAYAYGMICALSVGAIWQLWASWAGYNVSATQSIIGGIVGFALVWEGADGVKWAVRNDDKFPPYDGVLPIILSWFVAPILTALASAILFGVLRTFVIRRPNGLALSYYTLPLAVFLTTWINMYFVFTKGAAKELAKDGWTDKKSKWVSAVIALSLAAITLVIINPLIKMKARRDLAAGRTLESEATATKADPMSEFNKPGNMEAGNVAPAHSQPVVANAAVHDHHAVDTEKPQDRGALKNFLVKAGNQLKKGTEYDIHEVVETDPVVAKLHARAEKFDPRIEVVFSYLQVFSAIAVIFAHGAGEVGYMSGPLNQIYDVVNTGKVSDKSFDPRMWCIVLSAFSLVFGLATYGYNVMRAMGVEMAKLSPSRGFAAELATACVIMVAAQYGLPTSSSQCITGGIIGVGMLEGIAGVNWMYVLKQLLTWIGTLVVVGFCSAALFSNAIYTPSKLC